MQWFPYISRCVTTDGRLVIYRKRVTAISRSEFNEILHKWNAMYAHKKGLPEYTYAPDMLNPVVSAYPHEYASGHTEDVECIFNGPWNEQLKA